MILILVSIITVKPFFLLLAFVAYFMVVYELRSSILFLKLSLKSAPRSCVVVKISGNEPSLSTMQKKAPDEEVKYSLFKNRGRITQVFRVVSWMVSFFKGSK